MCSTLKTHAANCKCVTPQCYSHAHRYTFNCTKTYTRPHKVPLTPRAPAAAAPAISTGICLCALCMTAEWGSATASRKCPQLCWAVKGAREVSWSASAVKQTSKAEFEGAHSSWDRGMVQSIRWSILAFLKSQHTLSTFTINLLVPRIAAWQKKMKNQTQLHAKAGVSPGATGPELSLSACLQTKSLVAVGSTIQMCVMWTASGPGRCSPYSSNNILYPRCGLLLQK